jgi:hypothetical protein
LYLLAWDILKKPEKVTSPTWCQKLQTHPENTQAGPIQGMGRGFMNATKLELNLLASVKGEYNEGDI